MHHHLPEVRFNLVADSISLAYGCRVDHVSGWLAKGDSLKRRTSDDNSIDNIQTCTGTTKICVILRDKQNPFDFNLLQHV